MQLSPRQILVIGGFLIAVLAIAVVIIANPRGSLQNPDTQKRLPLVVWGVDQSQAFSQIIQNYEKIHKDVKVSYEEFREDDLDQALLNALAQGDGPDVVMLKNRTLFSHRNILTPVSPSQLNLNRLRELFPTVVEQDFVDPATRQIYALPLFIDTLALVYNKNALDEAGVTDVPKTWEDFSQIVPKLRRIDSNGKLTRAAAAIGGSDQNVVNGSDLVSLLLLQAGVALDSQKFNLTNQGKPAFDFYLQFSDPGSPFYTWSDSQPLSWESFVKGEVTMIFAYERQLSLILGKNPFASISLAPLPQPANAATAISYADYWGLAVPRKPNFNPRAWDFVVFATTQVANASFYLQATSRPPALRSLIRTKLDDPDQGVFAKQALTARSWSSPDDRRVRRIISEAIAAILSGESSPETALSQAERQYAQLLRAP